MRMQDTRIIILLLAILLIAGSFIAYSKITRDSPQSGDGPLPTPISATSSLADKEDVLFELSEDNQESASGSLSSPASATSSPAEKASLREDDAEAQRKLDILRSLEGENN
jgi:hypothetical protein